MVVDPLDHSNDTVQLMEVNASGELSIPDADPTLLHLINHEDDEIRMAAIWSLSEVGGADPRAAYHTLLQFTADEDLIEGIARLARFEAEGALTRRAIATIDLRVLGRVFLTPAAPKLSVEEAA